MNFSGGASHMKKHLQNRAPLMKFEQHMDAQLGERPQQLLVPLEQWQGTVTCWLSAESVCVRSMSALKSCRMKQPILPTSRNSLLTARKTVGGSKVQSMALSIEYLAHWSFIDALAACNIIMIH
jgi:hypothetical protein